MAGIKLEGDYGEIVSLQDQTSPCSELRSLTLLHSERPKVHRVLAVLSAIGLNGKIYIGQDKRKAETSPQVVQQTCKVYSQLRLLQHWN